MEEKDIDQNDEDKEYVPNQIDSESEYVGKETKISKKNSSQATSSSSISSNPSSSNSLAINSLNKSIKSGFQPIVAPDETIDPKLNLVERILAINWTDSIQLKFVHESFYCLFCLLSLDALATEHARTNTWEASILIVTEMQKLLDNFHLVSNLDERCTNFLPEGRLPVSYIRYVHEIKDMDLVGKYLEKSLLKDANVDEIRIAQFGSKVIYHQLTFIYLFFLNVYIPRFGQKLAKQDS